MLHEFTITMRLNQADEAIEKLNIKGFYNIYYDQPFEQFEAEDGYEINEIQDASIELKVILEDGTAVNIEKSRADIASILNIKEKEVVYRTIENQS